MQERTCSVESCEKLSHARGLCSMHAARVRRFGTTDFVSSLKSAEVRFFNKVPAVSPDDCWVWSGSRTSGGYGVFHADGHHLAHRWVYEFMVAPIPVGLHLDHLCGTRACVNPYHLDPVTPRVNAARAGGGQASGAKRRSASECHRGHAFDKDNTVWQGGLRRCRKCANERSRLRMARKRAEASGAH